MPIVVAKKKIGRPRKTLDSRLLNLPKRKIGRPRIRPPSPESSSDIDEFGEPKFR